MGRIPFALSPSSNCWTRKVTPRKNASAEIIDDGLLVFSRIQMLRPR
jgi:hypothetical protein